MRDEVNLVVEVLLVHVGGLFQVHTPQIRVGSVQTASGTLNLQEQSTGDENKSHFVNLL